MLYCKLWPWTQTVCMPAYSVELFRYSRSCAVAESLKAAFLSQSSDAFVTVCMFKLAVKS